MERVTGIEFALRAWGPPVIATAAYALTWRYAALEVLPVWSLGALSPLLTARLGTSIGALCTSTAVAPR